MEKPSLALIHWWGFVIANSIRISQLEASVHRVQKPEMCPLRGEPRIVPGGQLDIFWKRSATLALAHVLV